MSPIARALHEKFDEVCRTELQRLRRKTASLTAEERAEVDAMSVAVTQAIAARVEAALECQEGPELTDMVARLFAVAPADADVWDPRRAHGGTHVSGPERDAFTRLCGWGLVDAYRLHHREPDRYTWWDYRAGNFQRNEGMRIDHLLVTRPLAERVVWAEIDREARKGKPIPSDHAPVLIDIDGPGEALEPGWAGADERIALRRQARKAA